MFLFFFCKYTKKRGLKSLDRCLFFLFFKLKFLNSLNYFASIQQKKCFTWMIQHENLIKIMLYISKFKNKNNINSLNNYLKLYSQANYKIISFFFRALILRFILFVQTFFLHVKSVDERFCFIYLLIFILFCFNFHLEMLKLIIIIIMPKIQGNDVRQIFNKKRLDYPKYNWIHFLYIKNCANQKQKAYGLQKKMGIPSLLAT